MKVTRLKRGYRINVTDAEFAVIHAAVSNGLGDEPDHIGLSGVAEQRAWYQFTRFDAFDIDVDRRAHPTPASASMKGDGNGR